MSRGLAPIGLRCKLIAGSDGGVDADADADVDVDVDIGADTDTDTDTGVAAAIVTDVVFMAALL